MQNSKYVKRHCIICGEEYVPESPRVHTCMNHRGESTARFRRRYCCKCGKTFTVGEGFDWYFCSLGCKMREDEENKRKPRKRMQKTDSKKERARISKEAWDKEKMSYGQYVAKYNL